MDINHLDYLDIIFHGRNKAYGGYELRTKYSRRARRAGVIVIASAVLLSAAPTLASMMGKKATAPLISERIIRIAPPPVLPEKDIAPPTPPPPPRAFNPPPTIAAAVPQVVEDNDVERPPATVEDMRANVVSLTTSTGTGNPDLEPGPMPPGVPGGNGVELPKASRTIFTVVEQQAQFPGDLSDWLASHLRYPESAMQSDQQGRSVLQFVVNEDGSISDVKVVRSTFAALDAEALRVVRSMPKWKPGKQNGTAVASYFNLPIEFRLD